MIKVITYGTYDLLHYGHIRLLKRAKALGDYLIVGVTADDFDINRGKINVRQSLIERIEAVKATNLADEIIVEEYEGQKIDDIKRYDVDIFAIGSDWKGKFDYLKEYCEVVYFDRTDGISSSEIRAKTQQLKLGLYCDYNYVNKFINECQYVNGVTILGGYTNSDSVKNIYKQKDIKVMNSYKELLKVSDAIYIDALPENNYKNIKEALLMGKNVLCATPLSLNKENCEELFDIAEKKGVFLVEANKTAYSTAYYRMILLAKSGKIGKIVSVDATCTSLHENLNNINYLKRCPNSMFEWGAVALLPVFQLLGVNYEEVSFKSMFSPMKKDYDLFSKIDFYYKNAVAEIKVAKGAKSEGELIITGTKGYVYVPAPWWKTDYFEVRYESSNENKRYFYQLDGEGIRYEIVNFVKSIEAERNNSYINKNISVAICEIMNKFIKKENLTEIEIK